MENIDKEIQLKELEIRKLELEKEILQMHQNQNLIPMTIPQYPWADPYKPMWLYDPNSQCSTCLAPGTYTTTVPGTYNGKDALLITQATIN